MNPVTEFKDDKPAFYPSSREEWRSWLERFSDSMPRIWLILYHTKSGVPTLTLNDATEEALCFGWIDSLCKKRDAQSYYLTFTPRKPKTSRWSAPNRERATRMIEQGKMTPRGQALIDIAKETGRWDG